MRYNVNIGIVEIAMKEIKSNNVAALTKQYLCKIRISSIEDLSQAQDFFTMVIKDFRDGKLSLDQLSSFGFYVFHKLAKKHPESDLFQAVLSASELSFAIRSKATYRNISRYLEDIDNFYSKRELKRAKT
jgi:hypothetical protein